MNFDSIVRLPGLAQEFVLRRLYGRQHYIALRDHPIVYGRVPKAANSTVKIMLAKLLSAPRKRVLSDEFWRDGTQGEATMLRAGEAARLPDDRLVFTFIRNPYTRLASFYDNKVLDPEASLPLTARRMGISKDDSFERVVAIVCDTPVSRMDVHVLPQTEILVHGNAIVPSFVGRVENMRSDWDALRAIVAARGWRDIGELGPRKKGRKRDLDDYYTDTLRTAVRRKYEADFRTFYPEQL